MKTLHIAFLATALAAATGCAASAGDDSNTLSSESEALSDAPVWPPRVEVPMGQHGDAVCAHDDGETKKAFAAYVASKGGTVVHPSASPNAWPMENGVHTCRNCDLDGMTIDVPDASFSNQRIAIVDSTAAGAHFAGNSYITKIGLQNVYARGATFFARKTTNLTPRHVDLRCSSNGSSRVALQQKPVKALTVADAEDVDWSGASGGFELTNGTNIRFTGTAMDVYLNGTLADVRLDGMVNHNVLFSGAHVTGATHVDGSTMIVGVSGGTVFMGGSFSATDGNAQLKVLDNVATFDGVDMSNAGGGMTIPLDGGAANVRAKGGTKFPVGEGYGIVPDSRLATIDLSGAQLVSKGVWPAAPGVLDNLRLSGGALPAKTDLSHASLANAHLERVDFTNVIVSKLDGGRVAGARMPGALLQLAFLGGKDIDGVDFTNADLRGATLDGAHGSATFVKAKAGTLPAHTGANDTDQRKDTSFRGAVLGASHFDEAQLQYASFASAVLGDAFFDGAQLDFTSFARAAFHHDGIPNPSLGRAASMHAVDFSGADLRGVSLASIDVTPLIDEKNVVQRANFTGAFVCGGDLSNAKLGGANLSGLYFDVDGQVEFPDHTKGTCTGGKRAGASTAAASGIDTSCPLFGQHPADNGQCSDAQWRVQGIPDDQCDEGTPRKRNGGTCSKACECLSDSCTKGKCGDA